ncbi:MAG: phosphoenolpyruvate--protein phosphotransferase [Bacillota bacterium]
MQGIAASPGIAIGNIHLKQHNKLKITKKTIDEIEVEEEIKRLHQALTQVKEELSVIKEHISQKLGKEKAEIFEAHLMLLRDPELVPEIEKKVRDEKYSAEAAVEEVLGKYVQIFTEMEDEYMKGRKSDLQDVADRIIKILIGQESKNKKLEEKAIIVAHDLAPSDTARFDKSFVQAFVTEQGSRTSHTAIMAQSLGIPAVVGVGEGLLENCNQGDLIIVDGNTGKVIIRPEQEELEEYNKKIKKYEQAQQKLHSYVNIKAVTRDGKRVSVMGNIGNINDIDSVLEQGGEGIGLFRTEFLYMNKQELPSEDKQFEVYKKVAEKMNTEPVIIRTLDIGGGKDLPYVELPEEQNPFLGYRAIRISLNCPEIFKPQLKAILRASNYGNIKLMYPMVSSLEELHDAQKMLTECRRELEKEGKAYNKDIETGIMIEIPATLMIAEALAAEVDFFSIGTNDLIQYMVAVDRNNEKIAHLHTPYHPAVLRFIKKIVEIANKKDVSVGMCGEAAGDELLLPFLLGIGLDKLSMSAVSILKIKKIISEWSVTEAEKIIKDILELNSAAEVRKKLKNIQKG